MTAAWCPSCGSLMTIKRSKHGEFFGCIRYPDCLETIESCNREPFEPLVEMWMAQSWEGKILPPWAAKLAIQRARMVQRLESVRNTFKPDEWENLIGSVVLCSGGGKVALGQQRRRVELIVAERRRW